MASFTLSVYLTTRYCTQDKLGISSCSVVPSWSVNMDSRICPFRFSLFALANHSGKQGIHQAIAIDFGRHHSQEASNN